MYYNNCMEFAMQLCIIYTTLCEFSTDLGTGVGSIVAAATTDRSSSKNRTTNRRKVAGTSG